MPIIRRSRDFALLGVLAVSLLYGCGSGAGKPETPSAQEPAQEADTPALAAAQEEVAPPRTAAPAEESPPQIPLAPVFTEATVARIQRGMTRAQVEEITGVGGAEIGGDGAAIAVLRYVDSEGNYFTARFDDGALRTHSSLRQTRPAGVVSAREVPSGLPPEAAGDRPVAEIAPGVFVPLERAVAASSGQPRGVENTPAPLPEPHEEGGIRWAPPEPRRDETPEPIQVRTVVVAGGERPENDRSYRPRASLPAFSRSFRDGAFELRFVNPDQAPVQVGIRRDNLGLDTTVPPRKHASLKVDRGQYRLYFIRESEPYTRYEADPITIDGFTTTDLEIRLDPEDVQVMLIDYGQPENALAVDE